MVKIGVMNADSMRRVLQIMRTYRQGDRDRLRFQRLSLFVPQSLDSMIPEIVVVAMLDIDIWQRAIEARWTKEYLTVVLCYTDSLKKPRSYLLETQFDIVIARHKGYTAARCIDEMAQCLKERTMSSSDLV